MASGAQPPERVPIITLRPSGARKRITVAILFRNCHGIVTITRYAPRSDRSIIRVASEMGCPVEKPVTALPERVPRVFATEPVTFAFGINDRRSRCLCRCAMAKFMKLSDVTTERSRPYAPHLQVREFLVGPGKEWSPEPDGWSLVQINSGTG